MAEWIGVFELDGEDVDVYAEADGSLWSADGHALELEDDGGGYDDGDELYDWDDGDVDRELSNQVWGLRDRGAAISGGEEARIIEEAAEDGVTAEEVYDDSKALWRGERPARADKRRQVELAHHMAAEDGEVLDDYGRPERLIDLDDDTPERLEDDG